MNNSHFSSSNPSKIFVETFRFFGYLLSKSFWRVKYYNTENIPTELKRGLIIASNHPTYLDPFWICLPVKRELRFMAWDKPFKWILVGKILRRLGAFPTSLKRGGSIKALKESLTILKSGSTLVIFPEGEREFSDGNLLEFKTGVVRLALEAKVPILPVTVRGGNKIWAREHKFPRPGKIEVYYHPIMNLPNKDENEDINKLAQELTEKLKNIISSKLQTNQIFKS